MKLKTVKSCLAAVIALAAALVSNGETYRVSSTAAGGGSGMDWGSPMTFAEALTATTAAGGEIWMKEGVYTYAEAPSAFAPQGEVIIRGGFAGTEASAEDRPVTGKSTIDGENTYDALTIANDFPVTLERLIVTRGYAHGINKTSAGQTGYGSLTLENCEINSNGGKLVNNAGTANLGRGLNFDGSHAKGTPTPTLTITNCRFAGNIVNPADMGTNTGVASKESGTAMYAFQGTLVMTDTVFVTNGIPFDAAATAKPRTDKITYRGAALYISSMNTTLERCRFIANRASNYYSQYNESGAIVFYEQQGTKLTVRNCLFAGNQVIGQWTDSANATLVSFGGKSGGATFDKCTFAYNLLGGTQVAAIGKCASNSPVTIKNSIFYGNVNTSAGSAALDLNGGVNATTTVSYSLFASTGVGNIDTSVTQGEGLVAGDPLFVTSGDDFLALIENDNPSLSRMVWPYRFKPEKVADVVNMDFHVKSAQGYVDNAGVPHTAPGLRSPAIDAGDPADDYSLEPGENGGRLNVGCYAGTAEASQTPAAGQPEIDPEGVVISFPNEYTQPQIDFTMGGSGTYLATVTISCGTGELARAGTAYTWTKSFPNVGNGDPLSWKLPGYTGEGEEIYYSIVVTTDAGSSDPIRKQTTAQGTCPPWAGKGGGANVLHVRAGADGEADGSDWSNAFPDLGEAFANLTADKTEIWVTEAMPFSAETIALPYEIKSSVTIRGGFTGTENTLAERPAGSVTTIDPEDAAVGMKLTVAAGSSVELERFDFVHSGDRALTVTHNGADFRLVNCRVENNVMGVAVTGSSGALLSVSNCTFAGNVATEAHQSVCSGRGLYVASCGRLTVDDSLFVSNGMTAAFIDSHSQQGADGGPAIYLMNTKITARNVRFVGNRLSRRYSGDGGGVVRSSYTGSQMNIADSAFTNCLWLANEERVYSTTDCRSTQGGGVVWFDRNVKVTDATDPRPVSFVNCTIAYNLSSGGRVGINDNNTAAGINAGSCDLKVRNCIFYGNMIRANSTCSSDIRTCGNATLDVDYSLFAGEGTNWVSGETAASIAIGEHNVYGSPRFMTTDDEFLATIEKSGTGTLDHWEGAPRFAVDTIADTYLFNVHVRGGSGYADETTGRTVHAGGPISPAVDAGDPANDYINEPKPNGRRINLGFYGNTPWATMSSGGSLILVQ